MNQQTTFPTIKLYSIDCSTGCSCCSSENFRQGFYTDKAEPEKLIAEWQQGNGNPLASQYARRGIYKLEEHDAEQLPDGRIIIGSRIYESSGFQGRLDDY